MDDHSPSDEEQDGENESNGALTGFMFGNVDNNLKLVDDVAYIDEEAKSHLGALDSKQLGIGLAVKKDLMVSETAAQSDPSAEMELDSATAVNYEDITELAEEATDLATKTDKTTLINVALGLANPKPIDDDYDDDDDDDNDNNVVASYDDVVK
mmetsp:Transcript_44141/g.73489  ORF Transcript_44141/g.73489 Transcript_44141/m.73489 type:complete len:154 (-) Transcript_44141:8-469(-)